MNPKIITLLNQIGEIEWDPESWEGKIKYTNAFKELKELLVKECQK